MYIWMKKIKRQIPRKHGLFSLYFILMRFSKKQTVSLAHICIGVCQFSQSNPGCARRWRLWTEWQELRQQNCRWVVANAHNNFKCFLKSVVIITKCYSLNVCWKCLNLNQFCYLSWTASFHEFLQGFGGAWWYCKGNAWLWDQGSLFIKWRRESL